MLIMSLAVFKLLFCWQWAILGSRCFCHIFVVWIFLILFHFILLNLSITVYYFLGHSPGYSRQPEVLLLPWEFSVFHTFPSFPDPLQQAGKWAITNICLLNQVVTPALSCKPCTKREVTVTEDAGRVL